MNKKRSCDKKKEEKSKVRESSWCGYSLMWDRISNLSKFYKFYEDSGYFLK